ncbi:MAG: MFS transporter, partial [Gaiellaceae bacterium]
MRSGIDKRAMAYLSGGHATTDISQGAVAALLVFWRPELDLSYTEVTAIVLVATFSSSLVQPLFGIWSDRRGMAWLLPIGVATSGVGIALASIAPTYPLLLFFVFLSGLGVAAYHPEASKFARYVSGRRRSGGMSLFSIGGNLGFAIGPLLASTLVIALGLRGGLLLAVPAVVFAVVLASVMPYLMRFAPEPEVERARNRGEDQPRALRIVLAIVSLRSVGHMGLFAFIPLWEVSQGNGEAHGNQILSLFLFAGVIGTLIGGPLADRIGTRLVTGASHALSVPLILVYVLVGGVGGAVAVTFAGGLLIAT